MNGRSSIRDRGTVLPLVLVFVVALGLVIAGTTRYAGANLRFTTVIDERTAASAAAEAGLRGAIERVRTNSVTTCENGPVRVAPTHPETFNDAGITVTCDRLDAGQATLSGWAAVVTGEGIGSLTDLLIEEEGPQMSTGRIFVPSLQQPDFRINIEDVQLAGDLFYDGSGDDCATIDEYVESSSAYDDDIVMAEGSFVCWPQSWSDIVDEPPVATGSGSGSLPPFAATPPPYQDVSGCRVFEPGWYTSLDLKHGDENYFRSGVYVFDDVLIDTAGPMDEDETYITGGYPPDASYDYRLITTGACEAAKAADGYVGGPYGVTWYFTGSSRLLVRRHGSIELIPMLHVDTSGREHAVSIHVLGSETLADGVASIDEDESGTSFDHNHALFHGQIWSPTQPVDLEDMEAGGDGRVTSGVVAARLLIDSNWGSIGPLGPDRTATDHRLLLSSVATVGDVTIEAQAVVDHRPGADIDDRIAVRSFRFVD